MTKLHKVSFQFLALFLALALLTPLGTVSMAAEMGQSRASDYISYYRGYIYAMGSGKLEIEFTIDGMDDMDEIGALSIKLYESTDKSNWTLVKTYSPENYTNMLIEDDWSHSSCVSYNGIVGRYYKAYVGFWAGRNGGGDARYMWTTIRKAT